MGGSHCALDPDQKAVHSRCSLVDDSFITRKRIFSLNGGMSLTPGVERGYEPSVISEQIPPISWYLHTFVFQLTRPRKSAIRAGIRGRRGGGEDGASEQRDWSLLGNTNYRRRALDDRRPTRERVIQFRGAPHLPAADGAASPHSSTSSTQNDRPVYRWLFSVHRLSHVQPGTVVI